MIWFSRFKEVEQLVTLFYNTLCPTFKQNIFNPAVFSLQFYVGNRILTSREIIKGHAQTVFRCLLCPLNLRDSLLRRSYHLWCSKLPVLETLQSPVRLQYFCLKVSRFVQLHTPLAPSAPLKRSLPQPSSGIIVLSYSPSR